jgi:sarcosine oxidase subunit beta
MTKKVETLVIGGGAVGLSIAYNLMRKGKEAHVLEGDYLNAGATGRNVGVLKIRNHYALNNGNETLIELSKRGLEIHEDLSSETGINTFYKKSGCLIVAKDNMDMRKLNELHKNYEKQGVKDINLSPSEIAYRWPYIDSESIITGFYSPDEANAHPFGVVWAYIESIKRMKGVVEKQNKVTKIEKGSEGYKVEAENGSYEAENVVVAAAAHSQQLIEQLGYKVPIEPLRKEVLISEPIRPFFGPTLERLSSSFQVTQTMRGEIMGTIDWMEPGYDLTQTTSKFLNDFADEIVPVIPVLKDLNIIRQWTGICDKTPDDMPIVGEVEDNLYVACGFIDYGLTMVPVIGELVAKTIISGEEERLLKPLNPRRFT